jgi:predicted enzyme related to lactoylglutathione lyase
MGFDCKPFCRRISIRMSGINTGSHFRLRSFVDRYPTSAESIPDYLVNHLIPAPDENTSSLSRVFGVLLGLAFLILNTWTFREHYLLKHEAVPTQGQVIRTAVQRRKGGISYTIDYAFDAGGRHFEGSGQTSRSAYERLQPGGPIALLYVPSSPSISETTEMSHNNTSLFLSGVLGFPASLFILFLNLRPQFKSKTKPTMVVFEKAAPDVTVEMPNTVKGIAYTLYPVTDMARARRFYEEELGLRASEDIRGEWIEYHIWDNCFVLSSMTNSSIKPSADAGGSVAFEVNDVDGFVNKLKTKGIRVKLDPFSTPASRMAVVLDPEGNSLTLHQRKS